MVKKIIISIVSLICFLITALIIYFVLSMTTMLFLPTGELISSTPSPNGDYSINCYLVGGGATNGEAIRAELVNHKKILFKSKNIYWQYRIDSVDVFWESNNVVFINGIELDIKHDTFDYRDHRE